MENGGLELCWWTMRTKVGGERARDGKKQDYPRTLGFEVVHQLGSLLGRGGLLELHDHCTSSHSAYKETGSGRLSG